MKVWKSDLNEDWDSDFSALAKSMASEPAVVMKERVFTRWCRKHKFLLTPVF